MEVSNESSGVICMYCNAISSIQISIMHNVMSSLSLSQGLPPVHWNSNDYLTRLQDCLSGLLLPPPPTLPQQADWSLQCAQCMDYVRSISLPTDDVMAVIPLTSRYNYFCAMCSVLLLIMMCTCSTSLAQSLKIYLLSIFWQSQGPIASH